MINEVIRYFDLFAEYRTNIAKGQAEGDKNSPTLGWQLALFAALIFGIFAKVFLEYLSGKITEISWPRIIVAVILAIALFPGAYKKAMDDSGPSLVQLCVVFTSGLGVKSLVDIPGA